VVVLVGATYFGMVTALNTVMQSRLRDDERGRVMALWMMGFGGTVSLANIAFGPLVDSIGLRPVMLAGAVLAVALVGLAAGAWIGRRRTDDPADDFLVRHAARILPVSAFTPGENVIDVSDAESLHRVAERLDGLLLHHDGPDGQTLAVRDAETTYRYVFPDGMSQRPKPPLRAVSPLSDRTTPMARIA
jgi:MFS family permease